MPTFQSATEVPNPAVSNNDRRRTLRTPDGRVFVGKNDYCGNTPGRRNTVWLMNELACAEFARAASLRVPELRPLTCGGREYLGSEFLTGRVSLLKGDLAGRFTGSNRVQLTRALLLDPALLNSDRTAGNTLCDGKGLLWFFDYDKALCGDGRERHAVPPGDLYRLDPALLDSKFAAYLRDFLCPEARPLVFAEDNWPLVVGEYGRLPLDTVLLERARVNAPAAWVDEDLFRRMGAFLPLWWQRLRVFFSRVGAWEEMWRALSAPR